MKVLIIIAALYNEIYETGIVTGESWNENGRAGFLLHPKRPIN
jgi:hypothetical protein